MSVQKYSRIIDLSRKIAAAVGMTLFDLEKEREVALSRKLLDAEPLVTATLRNVEERGDCLGHGLSHVRKVAIDAGALIMIEKEDVSLGAYIQRMVLPTGHK